MYVQVGLRTQARAPDCGRPHGEGGVTEKPKDQGTPAAFAVGFKKTPALQPCVIEKNRGSSGEGIWIIKLKAANKRRSDDSAVGKFTRMTQAKFDVRRAFNYPAVCRD